MCKRSRSRSFSLSIYLARHYIDTYIYGVRIIYKWICVLKVEIIFYKYRRKQKKITYTQIHISAHGSNRDYWTVYWLPPKNKTTTRWYGKIYKNGCFIFFIYMVGWLVGCANKRAQAVSLLLDRGMNEW